MKVVVVRSPKFLRGILGLMFGIKRQKDNATSQDIKNKPLTVLSGVVDCR